MAGLQKRGDIYYIIFSKRINGKLYQKKFSLRTSDLKKAKNLKYDYEEQYELGRIDPFNGWSPKNKSKEESIKNAQPTLVTLKDLANKFVSDRSQANQETKKNYMRHLNMLKKQVGATLPVSMITEKDIREFCFKSKLRKATQASYLRHLKVFFRWLHENGHVEKDVTENITAPRITDRISEKTITESQLEKIFDIYRKDIHEKTFVKKEISTEAQSRVWFRPVVMIAFYAGLRRKEVVNLSWENINFQNNTITVTETKSGSERVVPIRKKLLNVLLAWHRKNGYPSKGLVFPSKKAYVDNVKISKDNITNVFKYYSRKANLSEGVTFHGLRHSCGTELMRLGFDINEVAKILGHSSIEVTRIYEHLTQKDLSDKMDRLESQRTESGKSKKELKQEVEALKAEIQKLRKDSKS